MPNENATPAKAPTTVENFLGELIGQASTTRFWDDLPENYPMGAGVFDDARAKKLLESAIADYRKLPEGCIRDSEDVLFKVNKALAGLGYTDTQIVDAVNAMLNEGVLFRERIPSEG